MPTGNRPSAAACWLTIDQFLERAALVLDSEIARREDLAAMGSTFQLIEVVHKDGRTTGRMERSVPADYLIESAASRVRAFFNEDDPIFHGRVTNALLGLLTGTTPAAVKEELRELKKAWAQDENNYRWALGVATEGEPSGQMRTDRQIARDWLYGDLVHADAEAQRRLRRVPREQRLLAALSWVSDVIKLTEATKRVVGDLQDAGCLTPRR